MDRRVFTKEQLARLNALGPRELTRWCNATDYSYPCPVFPHKCPFYMTGCCEVTYNHWNAVLNPKKKEKRGAHKDQPI